MKEQIIALAHEVCKANFMDFPDYDPDIELSLADALTILVFNNTDNETEIETDKLYDFIDSTLHFGELV